MSKLFKVPPNGDFYSPHNDSFGVLYDDYYIEDGVEWETCREAFLDMPFTTKGKFKNKFLFVCSPHERKRVRSFIKEVERQIRLPKRDRLKIITTNKKEVLCIEISAFWRKKVVFDLLTILLRAARLYTGRKFQETLELDGYIHTTRVAVKMFLERRTKLKLRRGADFYGWVDTFGDNFGRPLDEIDLAKIIVIKKK